MSIAEEFVYTTMGEVANIIENMNKLKYQDMSMYKNFLRIQIMSLAKNYNFTNEKDYLLQNKFGQHIFIDLIWKGKGGRMISSFIITDYYNEKVRQSLCLCDAVYKFWIYLGDKEIYNIKEIIKTYNTHFMPMSVGKPNLLCCS